jgi:hypothetical protein
MIRTGTRFFSKTPHGEIAIPRLGTNWERTAPSRTQRQGRNASIHRRAKQPTSSEVENRRPDLSGTVICVASTGPRRVRRSAEWRPYRAKFGFSRAALQVTLDGVLLHANERTISGHARIVGVGHITGGRRITAIHSFGGESPYSSAPNCILPRCNLNLGRFDVEEHQKYGAH